MRERWSKMMSKLPYRGKGWARSRGAADVRGFVVEGALEFVPDRRHVGKPPARCVIPGMPRPSRRGPIWCCVFVLRSVVFEECCFWGSIGLLRGISKRTQKKSVRVPFQRRVARQRPGLMTIFGLKVVRKERVGPLIFEDHDWMLHVHRARWQTFPCEELGHGGLLIIRL